MREIESLEVSLESAIAAFYDGGCEDRITFR